MGFKLKHQRHRFSCLAISGLILVLVSVIPIRSAIALKIAPIPQAILTLGGDIYREIAAARFAKMHPNLDLWISSGSHLTARQEAIKAIPPRQLYLDRRAVDTVTNFTSLVKEFKNRNFHHIYVITDDYHMRRAKAIATLVLGSQGIAFTPVSIPTNKPVESWLPVLRDVCRALLWIFTGHTGASLN